MLHYTHMACLCKPDDTYEMSKLLLDCGANYNVRDFEGATPVLRALEKTSSLRNVELLLSNGADITVVDNKGKTALHYAVRNRWTDMVKFVISKLVSLDETFFQVAENMKGIKFYNNVSLYSILMNSKRQMGGYARNDELVKVLEAQDYESKFPQAIFASLKERFDEEVMNQRTRKYAANNILSDMFKFNDPSHPIGQKILSYLSDSDVMELVVLPSYLSSNRKCSSFQ